MRQEIPLPHSGVLPEAPRVDGVSSGVNSVRGSPRSAELVSLLGLPISGWHGPSRVPQRPSDAATTPPQAARAILRSPIMAAPSGPPVFSNQELVNELESLLPTHWDEQQLERKWDACVANPDGGLERFAFTAMELKYLARERLAEVHARTRRASRRWRQT